MSKHQIFGREQILSGGMKILIKMHFSRCEQTGLRKPIGKGSWLWRSSEGKTCNLYLEMQKAFTANYPGKLLMGSNPEAPGVVCVFCWLTLKQHSQKCPSTLFLQTTSEQWSTSRVKNLKFFLMTVTIQLLWLWIKMTSVLFFASTSNTQKAVMSKLHIYSDRQLLHCTTRSTEKKHVSTLRTELCAQAGSACKTPALLLWLYPLCFKSKSPKPNSGSFSSSQPKPCYMRCPQTQKRNPIIHRKTSVSTILLFFLHMHFYSWLL